MPRFGAQCVGCNGEDCPCCEVYLEYQEDMKASGQDDGQNYSPDYDWGQHDFDNDPDW